MGMRLKGGFAVIAVTTQNICVICEICVRLYHQQVTAKNICEICERLNHQQVTVKIFVRD